MVLARVLMLYRRTLSGNRITEIKCFLRNLCILGGKVEDCWWFSASTWKHMVPFSFSCWGQQLCNNNIVYYQCMHDIELAWAPRPFIMINNWVINSSLKMWSGIIPKFVKPQADYSFNGFEEGLEWLILLRWIGL